VLTDPATYTVVPDEAWRRVKTRTTSGRFMAIVKELAQFREVYARNNNIPRTRVYKDDALLELASTKPVNLQDLGRSRLLLREARKGDIADGILAAVVAGQTADPKTFPKPDTSRDGLQINPAIADLLRVLLKAKSETAGVASKLIASSSDLDAIAGGDRDVQALRGWRKKVFGADALRLCKGEVGLVARGQSVAVFEI